ncbi:SDR family NAD(P)-dependent oxidoreductase [Leucothrix sargassi]|nr:SDR family NAD(P)-dependent oxidoreductase [Leucothrix sargassi]
MKKLLILTGGSSGLGKAVVAQYARNPEWHVVELSRSGDTSHNIQCDLTDPEFVELLGASLFPELASLNVSEVLFINNAADVKPISSVAALEPSEIIRNITLNQTSAFILLSSFIAAFRDLNVRKTIVNISSGAAEKGYAGWALYCASKAAADNFIRSIAMEEEQQAAPFIAVNYNPGVMDTDMQAGIRESDMKHFPTKQRFVDLKANGQLRTPEFVAADLIQQISAGMQSHTRYSVD